ncbi:MAG: hypothetical protein H6832_16930 [Planctomycetes bacterium]|nr:hypothetical protein [Planctomycetota bacterium]MCB9890690.1 hypothetical protein [Planctomycetota bacterium]MCB9920087.1 hypothetical protein [Planctomycetota bacterium]
MNEKLTERRAARWLFVVLLSIFVLGGQGGIVNPDAEVELQTARALWLRGSAALSEAHADASSSELGIVNFVPGPGRRGFDCMRGVDGNYYSWFGIGHAIVLVPFYAAGRALDAALAELSLAGLENAVVDAKTLGANVGYTRALSEEFFAHLLASLHSAIFAAGLGLVIFLALGHLGISLRSRVIAVLLACFTTQLWPGAREGMSDITAGFFLVASFERVLAWSLSGATLTSLVVAGISCGISIACRPAQLVAVLALSIYVVVIGWRRLPVEARLRWRDPMSLLRSALAFGLPIVPFLIALGVFNEVRFGDAREFGYTAGTSDGYWNFPWHLGVLFLLASPGKGALLFCPLLVIVPAAFWLVRKGVRLELLLAAAILVFPWFLHARMTGWHSSQAWATRYMTVGSVLVIAIAVAFVFDRFPRASKVRRVLPWIAAIGFVINLGGILTPYRGFYDLGQSASVERFRDVDPSEDLFQRIVLTPRLSPAIGHWLYAFENARGRVPAKTTEDAVRSWSTIYGVVPKTSGGEVLPQTLQFVDDREFRHVWPIGLARRFRSFVPIAIALGLIATLIAAAYALRRVIRAVP